VSELADKIEALALTRAERRCGPWYIAQEPHNYPDGTKCFTHVCCKSRDVSGTELTVTIGQYLTPDLAELLVTLHNNIPAIVAALRKVESVA
jgi:hypothetical protein